jgi:hypothetical protein
MYHIYTEKKINRLSSVYVNILLINTTLNYAFQILETCKTMLWTAEYSAAAKNILFWKHKELASGLWRSCLFLVLTLCTN